MSPHPPPIESAAETLVRSSPTAEPELSSLPDTPRTPKQDLASEASQQDEGESMYVDADDVAYDDVGRAYLISTGELLEVEEVAQANLPSETGQPTTTEPASHVTANPNDQPVASEVRETQARRTFRARPVPASLHQPSIQPRLSRAAMLRIGISLPPKSRSSTSRTSSHLSSEVGISGLPRSPVPQPPSLAPPTVAVRMNKATSARVYHATGGEAGEAVPVPEPEPYQRSSRKEVDFSSTPGHKRASLSVNVASLAEPSVLPKQTRASKARQSGVPSDVQSPPRERKPVDFSKARLPLSTCLSKPIILTPCSLRPRATSAPSPQLQHQHRYAHQPLRHEATKRPKLGSSDRA